MKKKKIFPDQIGNFNYIRNLRYDDSIPEILKDVYNSLKRISKNDYNIRKELLSKEINCYNGYNRFTQKEIVSEIESLFNTSSDDNIKTKIAEKIISLLPVNPSEKFIDIHNALRELIPYYIDILAVNLTPVETTITTELNYGLFIKYILVKLFTKIETMNKEEITHKINTIPKIIRFAWHYQINQNLYLLIDPKQYKIFVNQKYELNKIDKIYIREDFGNLKFTETERKLFEISNSKIINVNYEALFLNESFEEILQDYKINFRTIKFYDICNIIDTKIIEYYRCNQNNNLLDNKYEEFRLIFFSLNNILKENRFLRDKFPRFMKERGNIALKFLEDKDEEMDNFVEDVEKLIYFLTSK